MLMADVCFYGFLAALFLTPFRTGTYGNKVINMKKQGVIEYKDPFKRNCGLFTYYSYIRHDTSRACSSVAPHLILQTERGVTAKPVEFIFE